MFNIGFVHWMGVRYSEDETNFKEGPRDSNFEGVRGTAAPQLRLWPYRGRGRRHGRGHVRGRIRGRGRGFLTD